MSMWNMRKENQKPADHKEADLNSYRKVPPEQAERARKRLRAEQLRDDMELAKECGEVWDE